MQQAELIRYAALVKLARAGNFLAYAQVVYPGYKTAPHLRRIAEHLEAVERGDIRRLAISVPPQHGKSLTASGIFPSHFIARDTERKVIITSYAETLAETFSVQARDIVGSNDRFRDVYPDVVLSTSVRGANKWAVQGKRESCIAAGVGGAITGFGADLLIVDDPIKNAQQARSAAYLETLWSWFKTTARTRMSETGRIVVIQTRWVEDDLIGRLLEQEGDQYTFLHLPALSYGSPADYADPRDMERIPQTAFPDPLGRPRGAALWPEHQSQEYLEQTRAELGDDFQAMYQGWPGKPEGNKFATSKFHTITAKELAALAVKPVRQARSWDLAWSAKTSADPTASLKATLYVADPTQFDTKTDPAKLGLPNVLVVLEDGTSWHKEWDDNVDAIANYVNSTDLIVYEQLVETVAAQHIVFRQIRADHRVVAYPWLGVMPEGDKEIRAKPAIRYASISMFMILTDVDYDDPPWAKAFLKELGLWPNATNDDWVDTLSQLVNHWLPTIQSNLNATKSAQNWKTPFLGGSKPTGTRSHLPFEFRDGQDGAQRDRLGWQVTTQS